MDIKAVIFDLDGVLVFTDIFHYEAWKKIAEELSIPFSKEDNDRLRGVSRAESLEIILEKYTGEPLSKEYKKELLEKKNDIYRSFLDTMTEADVTDEVRETLKELRDRGLRLAVGSSSKNTDFILKKVGLLDAFDAVADDTHITRSKPDPEVFLKAAEFLGEEPKYCLVVEDADAGIEAAVRAGMHTAGIGDGLTPGISENHLLSFSDILDLV